MGKGDSGCTTVVELGHHSYSLGEMGKQHMDLFAWSRLTPRPGGMSVNQARAAGNQTTSEQEGSINSIRRQGRIQDL